MLRLIINILDPVLENLAFSENIQVCLPTCVKVYILLKPRVEYRDDIGLQEDILHKQWQGCNAMCYGLCMQQALGLMLARCVTIGKFLILFLCEKHHLFIFFETKSTIFWLLLIMFQFQIWIYDTVKVCRWTVPSFDATYINVSVSPVKIRRYACRWTLSEAFVFYHCRWIRRYSLQERMGSVHGLMLALVFCLWLMSCLLFLQTNLIVPICIQNVVT